MFLSKNNTLTCTASLKRVDMKILRKAQRKYENYKTSLMKPIYRVQQRRFDQRRDEAIKIEDGDLPLLNNVVVLLVYQPRGLSASLFHTLANIESEGFSAFVVLNSPITDADFQQLKEKCALTMKRQNFGYDFGGYRDAILHLAASTYNIDSVTCMNDSIWFPVFKDCDHLSKMLKTAGNLVGYSFAAGRGGKKPHLQSYLFIFKGKEFLKSTTFLDYWSKLQISNSRHFTIRNSELKMMNYFKYSGYDIGWLFSANDLARHYENSAAHEVIAAVKYLSEIGDPSASAFKDISDDDVPTQRRILISGLQSGNLYKSVIGGEPSVIFYSLNFAVMKKSKDFSYQVQRRRSIDCGVYEIFEPSVKHEIIAMNK